MVSWSLTDLVMGFLTQFLMQLLLLFGPILALITLRQKLSKWLHLLLIGVCILYGVVPLLLGVLGIALADQFGCTANIQIFTCPGQPELGNLVTLLYFLPWGAVFTIPSSLIGVIGLIVTFVQRSHTHSPTPEVADTLSDQAVAPDETAPRRLYRSRQAVIAGVCAGIAHWSGVNPIAVRIPFVVFWVVSLSLSVLVYWLLWLVIPADPRLQRTS